MSDSCRNLPLAERHLQKGARFAALGGWNVPADYGSPRTELRFIEEAVALVDFSFMTIVTVTGADRHDYLNRRLSQKILGLRDGDGCRANLLDANGRMQADLEVFGRHHDFLLLAAPFEGPQLASKLEQYVFSEDCGFEDVTGKSPLLGLVGPKWRRVLELMDLTPAPSMPRHWEGDRAHGEHVEILASSLVPGGCLLRGDAAGMAGFLWGVRDAVEAAGGGMAGWSAFNAWRIRHRCPWWGIEMDASTIPLEAGLQEALHHDKGCYPGQETIARITNLGHPARQLVAVESEGDAELILPLDLTDADGKPAGHLASLTPLLPRRAIQGLAMVKWRLREPGTELRAGDRVFRILPEKGAQ